MQYKNIIFDLGNVLVKLNPEGCIGAFKAIGMGELEIPDEKKERLLQLKKAGYRLFLLSNTIDIHWDYCVEHLFLYQNHGVEDYFEHCFLSQRMHLAKPDAHIYEEVIRQATIHPDETLFIDDLKENCEAAEKLGIHTFQNVKFDDWLAFRF